MLRKLQRNAARTKMKAKGMRGINKRSGQKARRHTSYFAIHWRDYI